MRLWALYVPPTCLQQQLVRSGVSDGATAGMPAHVLARCQSDSRCEATFGRCRMCATRYFDGFEHTCSVCSEFHRKKLARRLLNAGQVEQQEQTFLSRLKQQCGAQFTQKMEGMNNDLATAREKQSEFEAWLGRQVRF